ncbi:TetR/AcrR family transcriptional regulator [Nocardia neocaledoniensis]|uniref:TetR/AcrR family transcriptional regulator n=1 Tax=Nocardia neocaledoniensis TaxID=236511 RepID=UPI0024580214|nr:TetR/AcrR family transcriptional regulator [Nocardia neocaledoniensis]
MSDNETLIADRHAQRLQREMRRSEIIQGAGHVFARGGYHATSMDQISRYLGISKPVLYTHVSSKLELYLAALQVHLDWLVDNIRHALRAETGNRNRVHAAVDAYFDFVDADERGARLAFESSVSGEPSVQHRVDMAFDCCVDLICAQIVFGANVDRDAARMLAVSMVGASQHAARYWLESERSIPRAIAVDAVVALCWRGLASIAT